MGNDETMGYYKSGIYMVNLFRYFVARKREENRKNAKEFLRKGMKKEAWECFTRCVDVTPAMARELIKVRYLWVGSIIAVLYRWYLSEDEFVGFTRYEDRLHYSSVRS